MRLQTFNALHQLIGARSLETRKADWELVRALLLVKYLFNSWTGPNGHIFERKASSKMLPKAVLLAFSHLLTHAFSHPIRHLRATIIYSNGFVGRVQMQDFLDGGDVVYASRYLLAYICFHLFLHRIRTELRWAEWEKGVSVGQLRSAVGCEKQHCPLQSRGLFYKFYSMLWSICVETSQACKGDDTLIRARSQLTSDKHISFANYSAGC